MSTTNTPTTQTATHTPEPWTFTPADFISGVPYSARIKQGAKVICLIPNATAEVGNLIAAAPELHEDELKNLAWIENLLGDINAGRMLKPERIAEGLTLRRDAIRSLIAKAEGRA